MNYSCKSGRRARAAVLVLMFVAARVAASARGGEAKVGDQVFQVADGFTVERVAGPPLVDRPIVADFDERGRLYVADSSGSNDPVQKQVVDRTHRVVRLEDVDGDGIFDRRTVFADRMMFPEGAMWYDGSLYVAAPPSIWKLTDTNDDGVADRREEWFEGKTLTGCANDLHGPYLGLDGWIYWCKGAFARQTYERPGKPPFTTRAAHIFRRRPEGGPIEPVMTGGMDNPVDVVFTRTGERLFTTTFLQQPGGGKRDGLIHAIYGGLYGKTNGVLDEHPYTLGLMPPLTHMGPAAPCGFTRYEAETFGPEYMDNLFSCQFNMHRVQRHILKESGATFRTVDSDFLSASGDFHPTDVIDDADGSVVVLDTGGWYKLCCPSSQLAKPDVLGAIYRVRKLGATSPRDPRGLSIDWAKQTPEDLSKRLDDPRPAVRRRAIATLAQRGGAAVGVLEGLLTASKSVETRQNAVWALSRIEGEAARAAVRSALSDRVAGVRHAAVHAVSVRRDPQALAALLAMLAQDTPAVRRAALEAIGRLENAAAVPAILASIRPDALEIEHASIYALIEIQAAAAAATRAGLSSSNPLVVRAAMIALDQIPGGELKASEVVERLESHEPLVRAAALVTASKHPDWGGELEGYFRGKIAAGLASEAERDETARRLALFAGNSKIQALVAEYAAKPTADPSIRAMMLRVPAQANLGEAPALWSEAVRAVVASGEVALLADAAAAARALGARREIKADLAEALLHASENASIPLDIRLAALAAVPSKSLRLSPALFAMLRDRLQPEQPVATRLAAADVLARADLDAARLVALADVFRGAGALEAGRLLPAFEKSSDAQVGRALASTLATAPVLRGLRVDQLKTAFAKQGPEIQAAAARLYDVINVDASRQQSKLKQLLASLKQGDVRRGQAVFNGTKAACRACHAIGYVGGRVGPDLTRIGGIRDERDLLESIVFPSASFVRSFEPVVVATKDGRVVSGVLLKDAADEVVLATGPTDEARIARDNIDEMRPGSVSVMPAGFDQQLAPGELADLIAYLKTCR